MSKIAEKIMESFKELLPPDQTLIVKEAVSEFVNETEKKIRKEYETTLEESFKDWSIQLEEAKKEGENKLREAEEIALQGYSEAKALIEEKQQMIEQQAIEFENHIDEQFNIAKTMIDEEKAKNDQIENELYEAYTKQIEDIKEDLVDKIDSYLNSKIEEISNAVKKELRKSPEVLEQVLVFDKIKSIIADHISPKEIDLNTNKKIEALEENSSQTQAQLKIANAKILRLTTECQKYQKQINESTSTEKEEESARREEIRKNFEEKLKKEKNEMKLEGRGMVISEKELITENATDKKEVQKDENKNSDYLKLAGIKR